jgi:hypothetical protein
MECPTLDGNHGFIPEKEPRKANIDGAQIDLEGSNQCLDNTMIATIIQSV